MKKLLTFCMTSMLSLSTMVAHGQAVDSTGLDKLTGVSTRVETFIPAAIPGPAGATGATGAPGGSNPGTMCGLAYGTYKGPNDTNAWTTIQSCQGYRVKYNVGWKYSYDECPPGYVIGEVSRNSENNSSGDGNSWTTWMNYSYSCFKT